MDPVNVALHNFQTWFIPDLIMVSVDWMLWLVLSGQGPSVNDALRTGKVFRMVRVVRMIRMVRIAKLKGVLNQVAQYLDIEMLTICLGIIKLIGAVGIFAHFLACAWYGWVSLFAHVYDRNWITYIPEDE